MKTGNKSLRLDPARIIGAIIVGVGFICAGTILQVEKEMKIRNHYDPVCGCDGRTYQNALHAECGAGITNYTGEACE